MTSKAQRLQQRIEELQRNWDDLFEKTRRLGRTKIRETRPEEKFRLEREIEQLQIEQQQIEQELDDLEKQLQILQEAQKETEKEDRSRATGAEGTRLEEPPADPQALQEAYLTRLLQKVGYVPLADIDPQGAAAEPESRLNLDAVYTALLTINSEEQERLRKAENIRDGRETDISLLEGARGGLEKRKSALEQVDAHQYLVLLGGPGSGKSTFVNFVTMCLAGAWLGREDVNLDLLTAPLPDDREKDKPQLQPWRHGTLLPVRVILREFAVEGLPDTAEPVTGNHLWQFIVRDLEREGIGEFAPHLKRHLLEQGGLLLLDGLDEVPETDKQRPQIKQALEGCTGLFPHCRILVTSRTYAYQQRDWKLAGFDETVLATFTERQIRLFVER